MNKVTLGFSILALSAAFIIGCGKKTANVAPEADTETQSAVYASWATYVVSDIDMMVSFMGENWLLNHFYTEYPGSSSGSTGTVNAVRDTSNANTTGGTLAMAFNKTRCMDGKTRDGTVYLDFGDPLYPNAKYMREYQFVGRLRFSNYKVDGWLIDNFKSTVPGYIYNLLSTDKYSPATTKLTWKVAGKFSMKHPTDPSKDMVWDGELFKTLENTSNTKVFALSKQAAINWSLAVVSYSGHASGTGPQIDDKGVITPSVPFEYKVDQYFPLVRDFQCYPDKIAGVVIQPTVVGVVTVARFEEHHPFVSGVASFTTGTKYPRQIYYGNEGEKDILPLAQCDNTGEVLIKGISYRVDFMK